ncbi:MAG: SDR family oxidoreductase [Gemmatimonadota bacterium]|nr:SDR family oxidoreductase [Gemmatimonadota bacterium]
MAATKRFVAEGAVVALLARRAERLAELAAELGEAVRPFPVDVADPIAVAAAVASADETLGGLDIVINAAGVSDPTPLEDLHAKTWQRTIDINLSGSFYVAREAALRMMAADGGVIVNVGSELSSLGMAECVHYCASKAGIVGMTKALAAELAPKVRVNVVCPGPIDTPMIHAELALSPDPAEARREAIDRVPLKRLATPEEVVSAIRFLAVDAPYATGAVLPLDGGITVV